MPRTTKGARAVARPKADQALSGQVARLAAACDNLANALHEAPKAADLQLVAGPLRELAQAAPRLVEALQDLSHGAVAAGAGARPRLEQVVAELDSARRTIVQALDTLPRDQEYAAVARQLRELATVSPSLMEWLEQVPRVSTPLAASAKGLQSAASSLVSARDQLAEVVRELWPED